ncbi:MAG: replication factor C small subunit, partial [Candidatus Diapherotrites archaeon]|nr:replication factor C small subunit [Candidatus Diapherotrites archaeon]
MHEKEAIAPELPWVEKYRPHLLSDVVGQTEITKRLTAYAKTKNMPHLMFTGPAGVGKTSCAVALAKEMFGESFERNFLELNSSDARGIDVVRTTIKDFARTLAFDSNFKIIFLDESDALTPDAQQALRRTMEKFTKTTRFCLSANYSSRIIEPIQSRCVVFRFRPLTAPEIKQALEHVCKTEKITLDEESHKAIQYVSQGDLRKAINVLQSAASMGKKITPDTIYAVSSRAKPEELKHMIRLALDGKFIDAREQLDKLLYEHGMSGEDVITQLYRELMDSDEKEVPSSIKIELVDVIG